MSSAKELLQQVLKPEELEKVQVREVEQFVWKGYDKIAVVY